jgi:hypothetical protein
MTETTKTETPTAAGCTPAHKGLTSRKDTWWIEPALVAIGFTLFIVYATYRVFENGHYEVGSYLSPFYSPKFAFDWWKWSPAILILWIPAGFRATCYYYRKAYYRAYFWDPPGCSIGHMGGHSYTGETKFPFVFQNAHRYFFYLATVVLIFLWYDVYVAFFQPTGFVVSGINLFMLANVILLSGYSGGCHACRHLVGGRLDCFSSCPSAKQQFKIWHLVTKLNEHHMLWAWMSLFSVGLTDLLIRSYSLGYVTEMRFF